MPCTRQEKNEKKHKKALMKLLQFSEKSIREGKVYDNDQVFSELRKKVSQKKILLREKEV